MKIVIGTMFTAIDFEDDTLLQEKVHGQVHNEVKFGGMAVKQDGAFHSKAFKSGYWDGLTDFYDFKEDKFHTGLLQQFLAAMRELQKVNPNINYEIEDTRPAPIVHADSIEEEIVLGNGDEEDITLRDYQYESVHKAFSEQVGIINVATNGGKCLVKSSKLLTDSGYKTIEKIFEENNTPCETADKAVPANNVVLINRYGKPEKASHLTFNGIKKVKKIITDSGLEEAVTFNHPLLTVTQEGYFTWKKAKDIMIGDLLVTRLGDNVFGNDNTVTDEEEAFCIGALIADGYLGQKYKISFSNDQPALLQKMDNYFITLTNKRISKEARDESKGIDLVMFDTNAVVDWHNRLCIPYGVAKKKEIPQCIMESPRHIQLAFLSGYIECESAIDTTKVSLEIISASKKLLNQVQLLLKNLGILSTLNQKVVKGYEQNYYGRLNIRTKYAVKLLSVLTFKTEQRQEQMRRALASYHTRVHRPFKEAVPNGRQLLMEYVATLPNLSWKDKRKFKGPKDSGVGKDRMHKLLEEYPNGSEELKKEIYTLSDEHLFFDKVTRVEDAGEEPTFDVCMPETHSFIAESIINHNTEIASGIIQQALPYLKRSERVAFFCGSKEIFHQSAERIAKRLNIDVSKIGKIGDGKWDLKNKKIVFVMIPTLVSALKDPRKGIKFTPKENVIKFIAEEIVPKFRNTVNTRQLMRNYLKNCKLTTKVWQSAEEHLQYMAYDNKFTDKSVHMEMKKYVVEFEKIMEKKNKSKYKKYKETLEFLDSVKLLIADECHHSSSDSWFEALSQCQNAMYRIGLTGTVDEKNEMGLQRLNALFSRIITKVSNDFLIERGISSKPTIRLVPIQEPRNIEIVGTYMEAYKLGIVENDVRNSIIANLAVAYNRQRPGGILISVKEIEHGERILALLKERGVESVAFIHGKSKDEDRKGNLDKFSKKQLDILIATVIIDEGIDIKSIGCMILAASGKSLRQQLQRIGRGLRLNGIDGNSVMVFDFFDATNKYLLSHAKERIKIFKAENFDVKVMGK